MINNAHKNARDYISYIVYQLRQPWYDCFKIWIFHIQKHFEIIYNISVLDIILKAISYIQLEINCKHKKI